MSVYVRVGEREINGAYDDGFTVRAFALLLLFLLLVADVGPPPPLYCYCFIVGAYPSRATLGDFARASRSFSDSNKSVLAISLEVLAIALEASITTSSVGVLLTLLCHGDGRHQDTKFL